MDRVDKDATIPVVVGPGWWSSGGKRCFDLFTASLGLVLLSPFFLLVSLFIVVESIGSPFFIDERVGRDGHGFRMVKFRTMIPDSINHELGRKLLLDDPRVTRCGKFLRRFSLDELPQLGNILLGHMSLVGPRPGLAEHLDQYSEDQLARLLVRPGITGLAQVSGRNAIPWEDRIKYDVEYIQRLSARLDARIILATIRSVLLGLDLYSEHQSRDHL